MKREFWKYGRLFFLVPLLALALTLGGCDDGDDGAQGPPGAPGAPGSSAIDVSSAPDSFVSELSIQSEITSVTIASPPVVNFTVTTTEGVGITGIKALKDLDSRFVRFTIAKLVPGTTGDPDSWVSYTRDTVNDGTTPPDYDTGSSLVDHGDGTYTFTFNTNVTAVTGVPYEPNLTHRVAGQIGGSSPMQSLNHFLDFVPAGGAVTRTRNIAVIESCNECHEGLLFHGRRFIVEYCVTCHNPGLALRPSSVPPVAEGNMSFMIHRIHNAGAFDVLDGGFESEATYPQDVRNCRKCHNGDDAATAQGFNFRNLPNLAACTGCHDNEAAHPFADQPDNSGCAGCHPPTGDIVPGVSMPIETVHTTANATPNNPNLFAGQRNIAYEIIEATVDEATGIATVDFRITSDGTPLDLLNLPADLTASSNRPSFLLAYAQPQGLIVEPSDYNNFGNSAAQPVSVNIGNLINGTAGTLTGAGGIFTGVLTSNPFPIGATLRAIGLQGYFQQDLDGDGAQDVSLHTTSVVKAVTGDTARRVVVDNDKCAACHEFFEGHGGNRNFDIAICTMCHVPNLTSSGRAVNPVNAEARPSDAFLALGTSDTSTWPEDSNNLKDMIHGIHASAQRTIPFDFVRGRNDGIYYDWSHVTFPAEAGTSNCLACHRSGTYRIPSDPNLLPTTVRTTQAADGLDADFTAAQAARDAVPNAEDWVNSPIASSCAYCHDTPLAAIHMMQNGAELSDKNPDNVNFVQRSAANPAESCAICHGPGKSADVDLVHGL